MEATSVERLARFAVDEVMNQPAHLGIDVVEIGRFGRQLGTAGRRLTSRLFTTEEQAFCASDIDRFATTLAGKEAVAKALGTGFRAGVRWTDIEVLRVPSGRPYVRLSGEAAARATRLGLGKVSISLCHEGSVALAVACGVPQEVRP